MSKGADPDECESDEGQYAERSYGDITHDVPSPLRIVYFSQELELPGSW